LTLGKEFFAVKMYAMCSLPSVTLGKAFAECFWGFAVSRSAPWALVYKICQPNVPNDQEQQISQVQIKHERNQSVTHTIDSLES